MCRFELFCPFLSKYCLLIFLQLFSHMFGYLTFLRSIALFSTPLKLTRLGFFGKRLPNFPGQFIFFEIFRDSEVGFLALTTCFTQFWLWRYSVIPFSKLSKSVRYFAIFHIFNKVFATNVQLENGIKFWIK